jgi:hypothetical protein
VVDDDTHRLLEVRAVRLQRLRVLELQQERYGNDCPAHIVIEIAGLRRSLGFLDAAVESPLDDDIVEELGQSGRYRATDTRLRHLNDAIAFLGERLEASIDESRMWRNTHRQLIIIIGVAVIVILMAVTGIVVYLVTKGGL